MKTSEVLRAARELISVPERWTKNAFAKSETGLVVPSLAETAVCWCVAGACRKALGDYSETPWWASIWAIERAVSNRDVAVFNDDPSTAHADVLSAFDRAIAAEEAAGR